MRTQITKVRRRIWDILHRALLYDAAYNREGGGGVGGGGGGGGEREEGCISQDVVAREGQAGGGLGGEFTSTESSELHTFGGDEGGGGCGGGGEERGGSFGGFNSSRVCSIVLSLTLASPA